MKIAIVIWCILALSNAFSLVVPKLNYGQEHPVQFVDLVSDEEQLLSSRIGRQYYGNEGLPTQSEC